MRGRYSAPSRRDTGPGRRPAQARRRVGTCARARHRLSGARLRTRNKDPPMAIEQTFSIIKPDATRRNLTG
ncbi:MAG: hypothetical protein O9325_15295, partial [Roseomonas sp.]|nr:hypothetical protein [Roseomonas sp.]